MQSVRVFPHLTIEESLTLDAMGLHQKELQNREDEVKTYFDLFKITENGRLNLPHLFLAAVSSTSWRWPWC